MPMGGGAPTLTAELMARAVVAAARVYGDDPERAMTSRAKRDRRALVAAAGGLSLHLRRSAMTLAPLLGLRPKTVASARSRKCPAFNAAEAAAYRALSVGPALSPPAAASPEISPGSRSEPAGVMKARIRPPGPPTISGPATTVGVLAAERPVRDLVLEALADGPLNSMSVACRADRKELPCSTALFQLEREGLVFSTPTEGPRRFVWQLVEGGA